METSKSKMLFNTLDTIGVTEKLRQLHKEKARNFEILEDMAYNAGHKLTYNFGSLSEGTTTPGLNSDTDVVTCQPLQVVLNLKDAPKEDYAALLISAPKTAPGYVKLQLVFKGLLSADSIPKLYKMEDTGLIKRDRCGNYCWNNISRIFALETSMIEYINGPARTILFSDNKHFDGVLSVRCKYWPLFANEWLMRKRDHAWPDSQVISQCKKLGFFLVKTGHPKSNENDIEWRVSFSLQERVLMFNLTEVQHKCYVTLKLIKHDLIQGTVGESITSYHCKTCLLYTIEQNSQSIWFPDNLFECVKKCLKLLLQWTRKGECPNYFIPDNNMFDSKVTGEIRTKVIDVLEHILDGSESFIEQINTDNVGKYFIYINDKYELKVLENMSNQATVRMTYKLQVANVRCILGSVAFLLYGHLHRINRNQITQTDESGYDVLYTALIHCKLIEWLRRIKCTVEYPNAEFRAVIEPLIPFVHSSLACHLLSYTLKCNNISLRNKYLCYSEKEFQKGILSDVASGRLKYITSLYKLGKYKLCKQELVLLENQLEMPYISTSGFRHAPKDFNYDLQKTIYEHNLSSHYILCRYVCASVVFLPTELEIIPLALQFEMFRATGINPACSDIIDFWHGWVVVESKVYMYFLWYLLMREINASLEERLSIVLKMKVSADNSYVHAETAYNLLAWVLQEENFIPQVIEFLLTSWSKLRLQNLTNYKSMYKEKSIQFNAAKWHMLVLLQNIWFSKKLLHTENDTPSFCFKCFKQCYESCVVLKKCSNCKTAQYCSRICQEMDWNVHCKICKKIR